MATTWSPTDQSGAVLSNGDLTVTGTSGSSGGFNGARSNNSISTGKNYAEFSMDALAQGSVGLADQTAIFNFPAPHFPPSPSGTQAVLEPSGYYIGVGGQMVQLAGAADIVPVTGDVVSVAADFGAGVFWFAVNGVWLNGGVPASGLNPNISFPPNLPLFLFWHGRAADTETMRVLQNQFGFPVPNGFNPWGIVPPAPPTDTANFYIDNCLVHRDDKPKYSYN